MAQQLKALTAWAVVVHACNPSTLGGNGRRISEFEASLVYRVSSRTARATQRNPVSKKEKKKPKKTKTKKLKTNKQTKNPKQKNSQLFSLKLQTSLCPSFLPSFHVSLKLNRSLQGHKIFGKTHFVSPTLDTLCSLASYFRHCSVFSPEIWLPIPSEGFPRTCQITQIPWPSFQYMYFQ